MNITLTGASGFLGARLTETLRADGDQLHVLGRRPVEGAQFSAWDAMGGEPPREALESADAIIHLAGEPVAQRWTSDVKQRVRNSRIAGTRHLVHALSTLSRRPEVLISASAIGIYGSQGDQRLTESSPAGKGFLAEVCQEWEHEAELAEALGLRVVRVRIGVVLGKGGGALEKMLPPFRMGLGGRLGSGKQWVSWIHLGDAVNLIAFALRHKVSGPLNATSPNPVSNAELTNQLSAALHRPALFAVPGIALKLAYGEMAEVVLGGQRVIPKAALNAGYHFRFPELGPALADTVTP